MCLVNDNQEFNTIKHFFSIQVGVTAITSITVNGVKMSDGDTLELVEDDTVDIACNAEHGYPAASISWTGPEVERDSPGSLEVSKVIMYT